MEGLRSWLHVSTWRLAEHPEKGMGVQVMLLAGSLVVVMFAVPINGCIYGRMKSRVEM